MTLQQGNQQIPHAIPITIEWDASSLKLCFKMPHHRVVVRRVVGCNGTNLGERK